jgi:putative NADH-flavin reductase
MPVIVVGADTPEGLQIVESLVEPGREIRAFVSDALVGSSLKSQGIKVALGDVSDDSHVEGAATGCFSAILVVRAANDDRERSFATQPGDVLTAWARAVRSAGVTRVIWVSEEETPSAGTREVAVVSPSDDQLVEKVAALDDAQMITSSFDA